MTNRFEEGAKHLLEFKNQNLSKLNSLPRLEKVDGVYVLSQEYKKYIESHIQVEDSYFLYPFFVLMNVFVEIRKRVLIMLSQLKRWIVMIKSSRKKKPIMKIFKIQAQLSLRP